MLKKIISIALLLTVTIIGSNCKADESSLLNEANNYVVKNHSKAIELYEEVLKTNPKNAEAYYNIGRLYLWDDQPEKSLEYMQKALKYNPKYVLAYNAIATNCDTLAEYDLTQKYIKQFREEFPNNTVCNSLADELEKKSSSNRETSKKIIAKVAPNFNMNINPQIWDEGLKIECDGLTISALKRKGATIISSTEGILFFQTDKVQKNDLTPEKFAEKFINKEKEKCSGDFKSKILEKTKDYIIFEIITNKGSKLLKCSINNNIAYIVSYVTNNKMMPDEKKSYWISTLKKTELTY